MMRFEYLLVVCSEIEPAEKFIDALSARARLPQILRAGNVLIFANDPDDVIAFGDGEGIIVGKIFPRQAPTHQLSALPRCDEELALATNGQHLIDKFWGSYVAVIARDRNPRIIRDPSGGLACYWSKSQRFVTFSSDAETLVRVGTAQPSVDWNAVGRFLFHHQLPSAQTAVDGIAQLLPGNALSIEEACSHTTQCWTPWDHIGSEDTGEPNSDRLFDTVHSTVYAWSSCFERPLVGLSGGLDSSIVAACLAMADTELACVTLTTSDAMGDEVQYARAVGDAIGSELLEMPYLSRSIDLAKSVAAGIPFPCGKIHEQAYNHAVRQAALTHRADAFFVGAGGDNVFYLTHSARPLVDRFRADGVSTGVRRTLRDICQITGASVGQVLLEAVRLMRVRSRQMNWSKAPDYLHPDVVAFENGRLVEHPWLSPPRQVPLAKLGHASMILQAMNHLEHRDKSLAAPMISPLLSQPIVELCLSIPSWEVCDGGIDRSVARRAFASLLPRQVVGRAGKGSPDGFIAQFIDRNRLEIFERLYEGKLASNKIIDRTAIEGFRRPGAVSGLNDYPRIMALLDAEAWVESWTSYGS